MGYKIAVLMGGASFEREFSLKSGKRVCECLEAAGHKVLALDTTPQLVNILRSEKPDAAYIALHGGSGEDGTVQSLLEYLNIPYVGSPSTTCRLTHNKYTIPHILTNYGDNAAAYDAASWPASVCLAAAAFKDMGAAAALDLVEEHIPQGYPLCVKPACGGSAMGISRVDTPEELAPAILDALSFDREVIIQKWVEGVEMGVCVLETEDGLFCLPPVEVCAKERYDTAARLDSDSTEFFAPVRPESLSADPEAAAAIRAEIERAALDAFSVYRCRDLGRVDLIWDGARANILEVDISPGMSPLSFFPAAVEAADMDLGTVLSELIERAIRARTV